MFQLHNSKIGTQTYRFKQNIEILNDIEPCKNTHSTKILKTEKVDSWKLNATQF